MTAPKNHHVSLQVDLAGLSFKNPVIAASGTFGYGGELAAFFPPDLPGGISTKGISLRPRPGNPPPRMAETPSGVLNSIGLQNIGLEAFITEKVPYLKTLCTQVIVNIAAHRESEFLEIAARLDSFDFIPIYEINVSCPNVKEGGMAFGQDPRVLGRLIAMLRQRTKKHLMVKLSPNVTSIAAVARAAADNGADSVSLINTVLAMDIDVRRRTPKTNRRYAGLSGPAIRPIALRMVHEVKTAVSIPIVGMGGIMTAEDAVAFMLAGATLVQVGTGTLSDPMTIPRMIEDLPGLLTELKVTRVTELIGALRDPASV